ncbi:MAG: hypothetical protein JWP11_3803 [Frankiales bacterium]|nr:hypothetical protein [Frankiales bacterium]
MTYVNSWPVVIPALAGFFTVLLAVELVIALAKSAAYAGTGGGEL